MSIQSPETNPPYSTIVEMVRGWPAEQRLALAQHLLNTLESDIHKREHGPVMAREIEGLLRGQGSPPTDEEVKGLVSEYLDERYG